MKRMLLAAGLAVALAAPAMADDIFNSNGFEPSDYSLGPLGGQNGWLGEGANGGIEPMVVESPDPVIDSQAIRFEIPDIQGANSYADVIFDDILAQGYTVVTVSFDIYRTQDDWISNLWWWWFDAGDPTYGIQWDEAHGNPGGTYPFGWVEGATGTLTLTETYATVEMIWDFNTGVASSYYHGEWVCDVDIVGIESLTGWAFLLAHDEGEGSGPDVAWVDNFLITASTGAEFTLEVSPDPLIGGQNGRFLATNGNPSEWTYLAYSLRGEGSTFVPFLNVTLDLNQPKQAGDRIMTDEEGAALWTLRIPGAGSGRNVWLQACQFENKTNVVATSIE